MNRIIEDTIKRVGITPTPEQLEEINEMEHAYNRSIAYLDEQENYRMQNYYDCIDDYSWGGLCSKANSMARDRENHILKVRVESLLRGGYIVRTRKVNILRDKETGELAAVGTHKGRFGRYFRINDAFKERTQYVPCAIRVSTYEKKGFVPYVQSVTEELTPDGYWSDGNPRFKFRAYVSITEEVSTEIQY